MCFSSSSVTWFNLVLMVEKKKEVGGGVSFCSWCTVNIGLSTSLEKWEWGTSIRLLVDKTLSTVQLCITVITKIFIFKHFNVKVSNICVFGAIAGMCSDCYQTLISYYNTESLTCWCVLCLCSDLPRFLFVFLSGLFVSLFSRFSLYLCQCFDPKLVAIVTPVQTQTSVVYVNIIQLSKTD